jgi:DMSO reductase family type II enzyme heme b subunit
MNARTIWFFVVFCAGTILAAAQTAKTAAQSPGNAPVLNPQLQSGKAVYDQHCAACHGVTGDGNGPAAVWVFPKPRNFSDGLFKIQSTPAGSLPSDEDLLQVITRGMPGSSMPSFTYLSERERLDAVEYVKYLTAYTDDAGNRLNLFDAARERGEVRPALEVPPEPPMRVQALVEGKELFAKLQCAACHGETGAGDGPSAASLKDRWELPLLPRDFNIGAFRGGHTGRDLYLRIATGMAGTPMPPFGDDLLTPEQRWAVVLYVQSLRRKDIEVNDILAPADNIIHGERVRRALPVEPMDPFWETMDPVRVPLNPLWPEPDPVPAVAVRAVHDGRRVAILCQWRDAVANGAPVRVQDFQDAVSLQFSLNGNTPFVGMGDLDNPVNIWQWKAGWQQEVDGNPQDVREVYNSMHVDTYFQPERRFRTAADAGNLLAVAHRSPVEDANARGFGTFAPQPLSQQNVQGKGVWRDGFWSVVFVRELRSRDPGDVRFAAGKPAPVAFAVWDGEQRDRNGRKLISNWYQLVLE